MSQLLLLAFRLGTVVVTVKFFGLEIDALFETVVRALNVTIH